MEIWRHAAGVASKEVWSSSVLFVAVGISSFRSSLAGGLRRLFPPTANVSCNYGGTPAKFSGLAPKIKPATISGAPKIISRIFRGSRR